MATRLDARDLRLVTAIAAAGSVAGAARALDCSQPTASQHLAALETRLGARLVERGPRGARLTELGALLVGHADELLDRLEVVEADVRRHIEHGVSTLRLGAFTSAAPELASRAIARLVADGLHVELIEAQVPELLRALRRRELHAGIVFTRSDERPPALDGIAFAHLLDDEHLVVLPAGHPAAAQATVALTELRDERWIAAPSDEDASYATLVQACRSVGFEPTFAHRIDDLTTTQGFVAAGLGISPLPRLAVEPLRDDVVVRPLARARIVRTIHLAYLESLAPALRDRLLAALSAQARRLEGGER
jgi:molybdate transport repressor ModE-like protein